MQYGPPIERIEYATPQERTEARKAFWQVVNGGHNVKTWSSASMLYWAKVQTDLTD